MVARFGENSCWEAKEVRVRHDCSFWKSIQKMRESFWKFIRFNLGLGREIPFWEDMWIGEVPLKTTFKNIYSLAVEPKGRVVDSYDVNGNIWNPGLRRNLNDWELAELGSLLGLLNDFRPNPSLCDNWEWSL